MRKSVIITKILAQEIGPRKGEDKLEEQFSSTKVNMAVTALQRIMNVVGRQDIKLMPVIAKFPVVQLNRRERKVVISQQIFDAMETDGEFTWLIAREILRLRSDSNNLPVNFASFLLRNWYMAYCFMMAFFYGLMGGSLIICIVALLATQLPCIIARSERFRPAVRLACTILDLVMFFLTPCLLTALCLKASHSWQSFLLLWCHLFMQFVFAEAIVRNDACRRDRDAIFLTEDALCSAEDALSALEKMKTVEAKPGKIKKLIGKFFGEHSATVRAEALRSFLGNEAVRKSFEKSYRRFEKPLY